MLQEKEIKKIQELKADFTPTRVSAEDIFSRFKALKLSEGLSEFKWFKTRGYDFKMVLAILVSMVVSSDKTVNSYLNSPTGEGSSMGKDVFYRLKNTPFICWRVLMWRLVHRFLKVTSKDSDVDDTSSRYLIFDDTTLSKTGKRIKGSYTAKRVEELDTNKIQMVLRVFFTAIYRSLHVDYILVDSWFTCDALIQAIRSVKNQTVYLIGMYKFAKTKFEYQGKSLTHDQINNMLGKPRRCRSLGYQYKQAKVLYQGVEICLFFSRKGHCISQ